LRLEALGVEFNAVSWDASNLRWLEKAGEKGQRRKDGERLLFQAFI